MTGPARAPSRVPASFRISLMSFMTLSPDPLVTLADELTQLELRIARRADELAAMGLGCTKLKLSCWLQAEEELLGGQASAAGPGAVPETRTA